MPDEAPLEWNVEGVEEDDTYLMSNFYPRETGLPMTVWVNVKGGARHDVRVKVSPVHGQRIVLDDLIVIGVRPEPRLLHGALSATDFAAVSAWIKLNQEVIVDHWNGVADTSELVRRLQRLPG